ncbi:MAG: hypothetical protein K2W86_14185 [Sphingomonas sp.]|uniref:hypothetical protein n=1 Tax=Sphingomonas sp. TaxID=28214 RepID=UPI0035A90225|nr:hypothetical protein [Sphingomonas sp.]
MKLFEILQASGAKLSVFAAGFDEAAGIFTAWYANHHDAYLSGFEVAERNPSWPGLNTEQLRQALALNISGVGRYDPDKGWTILPTNAPVGDS